MCLETAGKQQLGYVTQAEQSALETWPSDTHTETLPVFANCYIRDNGVATWHYGHINTVVIGPGDLCQVQSWTGHTKTDDHCCGL